MLRCRLPSNWEVIIRRGADLLRAPSRGYETNRHEAVSFELESPLKFADTWSIIGADAGAKMGHGD